jgi:peptide-methionine (R)-S-oxide reductase
MDDAKLAISIARGRIAFGIGAIVAPGAATRLMARRRDSSGIAPLFARMLGARDLALGLGTVIALDRGKPVRGWLEASALADTADCVASVLHREEMAPNAFKGTAVIAAASAALGAFLSRRLDPSPPPDPGHPEAVATGHPPETAS